VDFALFPCLTPEWSSSIVTLPMALSTGS